MELNREGIIPGYEDHPMTREEHDLMHLLAEISIGLGCLVSVRMSFEERNEVSLPPYRSSNRYSLCFAVNEDNVCEQALGLNNRDRKRLEELINSTTGAQLPGTSYWLSSLTAHEKAALLAEIEARA